MGLAEQTELEAKAKTKGLMEILKENVSEYFMFIALIVIMIYFSFTTDGAFISPRNISNLFNQVGYIAVLAVGMTLVIIIRHIDLSVGYLAGCMGAFAAIAMTRWGMSVWVVLPIVLILGVISSLVMASPIAKLGVRSFVSTMLIFRGPLLRYHAQARSSSKIRYQCYRMALSDLEIPALGNRHILTLLIGAVAIVLNIFTSLRTRRAKIAYKFEVPSFGLFILQMLLMSVVIGYIAWVLSGYNGISWSLVLVILVVAVFQFITTKTPLGRHIYAVGGNPEAAELSGISVQKITFIVFGAMGFLSALSGVMYASRLQSATTTAGLGFETDAIAAAFVGGVSAAGGVGTIVGSIVGALVMMSLNSGMNLMGIDSSIQYIVRGAVLVLAVIFDRITRKNQ